jgi:uncharacterized protein (TIGR03435 family)
MNRDLFLTPLAIMPVLLPAQPASKSPEFEVADIKPSDPSVLKMGKGRMLPGGRIEVPGYTLRELIMFTYGVTDDMISGGPKWVGEDRFDIVAKAPTGAPDDALRSMMKALLGDRFRLVTHQEDKPMAAYVLTVEKNAAPLARSAGGGTSQCHWTQLEGGLRRRECRNLSMDEFARDLQQTGGIGIFLPVSDQTGLKGNYDFQFDVGMIRRSGAEVPGVAPDPLDTDGPNIFAALSKIGLKLESRKVPMPAIVIDSAARPGGN